VNGGRQNDEVGESDAGQEQERRHRHHGYCDSALLGIQRRDDKCVALVNEHWQCKKQREIRGDHECGRERLADPNRDREALGGVVGQRGGGGLGPLRELGEVRAIRGGLIRGLSQSVCRARHGLPGFRLLDRVAGQSRDVIRARGRRGGQSPIESLEQGVVLPEADRKRDRQGDAAHDQARAQLVEVVDDAQAVFVPDRPEDLRHPCPSRSLGAVLS
jgi:hypothetical protein